MLPFVKRYPGPPLPFETEVTVHAITAGWAHVDLLTSVAASPNRHFRSMQVSIQVDAGAHPEDIANEILEATFSHGGIPVLCGSNGIWRRAGDLPTPLAWPHNHDLYDLIDWARNEGVHLALPARRNHSLPSLCRTTVAFEDGGWFVFVIR